MLFERPQYGWHAAMIVSVVGFKDFEKYTHEELAKRGILLRERSIFYDGLRITNRIKMDCGFRLRPKV